MDRSEIVSRDLLAFRSWFDLIGTTQSFALYEVVLPVPHLQILSSTITLTYE